MQKIALAQYRFELLLMTTKVSVCMVQQTAEGIDELGTRVWESRRLLVESNED